MIENENMQFWTGKGGDMQVIETELSNKQVMAIANIIGTSSMEAASRKSGISKATLYGWLKNEAFSSELKRQRDEIVNLSTDRLKVAMTEAVDGLIELLKTDRPELKRVVCKDILEFALRAIEIERISERLDEIERVVVSNRGCI